MITQETDGYRNVLKQPGAFAKEVLNDKIKLDAEDCQIAVQQNEAAVARARVPLCPISKSARAKKRQLSVELKKKEGEIFSARAVHAVRRNSNDELIKVVLKSAGESYASEPAIAQKIECCAALQHGLDIQSSAVDKLGEIQNNLVEARWVSLIRKLPGVSRLVLNPEKLLFKIAGDLKQFKENSYPGLVACLEDLREIILNKVGESSFRIFSRPEHGVLVTQQNMKEIFLNVSTLRRELTAIRHELHQTIRQRQHEILQILSNSGKE